MKKAYPSFHELKKISYINLYFERMKCFRDYETMYVSNLVNWQIIFVFIYHIVYIRD